MAVESTARKQAQEPAPPSSAPPRTTSRRSSRCWARSSSTTRRSIASPTSSSRSISSSQVHQQIYDIARSLIRTGKLASPVTLKTFLPADVDIAGLTLSAIPRTPCGRSDHHHQRRGLRAHGLRPRDPPRPDQDRRGHGQRRLRRAGRFRAARADRGRRAPALRPRGDRHATAAASRNSRPRSPPRSTWPRSAYPARRQAVRAGHRARPISTARWAACRPPT